MNHPTLRVVHATVRGKQVRRISLPKTEPHLYHSADEASDTLLIHGVWGPRRGKLPRL